MIYVHVPFCRSFCTYCGFYSEVCGEAAMRRYADAACTEIAQRKGEMTGAPHTLYIGGGTPSVLPLAVLSRLVEALPDGPYAEFTLEVNPEDIVEKGPDYLSALRALGVNRISMGVQSFDDGLLRRMNRRHDAARAEKAFRMLREAGFGNVSIDLIFGAASLTDAMWEETLRRAVALAPEHISCYQLSVEDGSALADLVAAGRYEEAPEERCRGQYDRLCQVLAEAGYHHYEISNFARPGFEAVHNSAYWRRVPYVGIGPGAHSFDGRKRRWNSETLPEWTASEEELSEEDARVETLMLGLRTDAGLSRVFLHKNCSKDALDSLCAEGALVPDGDRLRIPEDRFFVSDEIIRELI